MKDKKLLYVVLLIFIFFLSVGLTYAYFATTVSGNGNVTKASVGTLSILYTDGPEIVAKNVQPSWTTTKTISIENTGTLDTNYSIEWASLVNEITNDELIMSATCIRTLDGVISGTCSSISVSPVASTSGSIVHNVNIEAGYKHTYAITFEFIETSSAQNYNQGKAFNGVINILGETYTLAGVLYDSNGDPIEGATIEMHSNPKSALTDSQGNFEIVGLESGDHTITVTNASDQVIATDSISLTSGNSVGVNSKKIVASKYTNAATIEIRLGASNINTITPITTLTDKILIDNTAYADNIESQYVKGRYTDIYDFAVSSEANNLTFATITATEAEGLSSIYYDTISGLYFNDKANSAYVGNVSWDSGSYACMYNGYSVHDILDNTLLEYECQNIAVYEIYVPVWDYNEYIVMDLEEKTNIENHIFTGMDHSKSSVGYNGISNVNTSSNQSVNICYSSDYCGGGASFNYKNESSVVKANANILNKDYSVKKLFNNSSFYEYATTYTFDSNTNMFTLLVTNMSNNDPFSTGFTENSVGKYSCYYEENGNSYIEVSYGENSTKCDKLVKILEVDSYGNITRADIISSVREVSNGQGLYYTTQSEDTENGRRVYYFTGDVKNNYLTFGGFCWRIVRTVENGGVKLRYGGVPNDGVCPQTGESVSIGSSIFNNLLYSKKGSGYMYGDSSAFKLTTYSISYGTGLLSSDIYYGSSYTYDNETEMFSLSGTITHGTFSSLCVAGSCSITNKYTCVNTSSSGTCEILVKIGATYTGGSNIGVDKVYPSAASINEQMDNIHSSDIKEYLDTWYENNLLPYSSLIADTPYCNDRTFYKEYGTNYPYVNRDVVYNGNNIYKRSSYVCPQGNDMFTVSSKNGNGKLTYPIGLLTLDEVLFAGGENNYLLGNYFKDFYLYTGDYYWLMTPSKYFYNFSLNYALLNDSLNSDGVGNSNGVLPVIALKSSVVASSGNGTYNNPYVIE